MEKFYKNILEHQLATRDRQVVELSEKLRKLDISKTIRHSILNCVDNWDLREEFKDIENKEDLDGLQYIIDRFTALGIKKLRSEEVDDALKIFRFLFKFSFSAVPTRVEQLTGQVDRVNTDLQNKIEYLQELRMKETAIDVDIESS